MPLTIEEERKRRKALWVIKETI